MRRTASILLTILILAVIPTTVFAQDMLETEILTVREVDGEVVLSYDTGEGEVPEEILYAVTNNGQFVWDGIVELSAQNGLQQCKLDIPLETLPKSEYDLVAWGVKTDADGSEITSSVFAFKVIMGSSETGQGEAPRITQPIIMLVQAPFAYIAKSANMADPICYLKSGDTVQVYSDTENSPIVYVVKGNIRGYMYSRTMTSEVFDLNGEIGLKAVEIAKTRIGDPYSKALAGTGRYLDCSYLAMWTYRQLGIYLPRTAAAQGQYLTGKEARVAFEEMQPGDLIFWSYKINGRYLNISHVGIYAGDGKVIEALNPRVGVVYRNIQSKGNIVFCASPQKLM